jgi:hypothetical protein
VVLKAANASVSSSAEFVSPLAKQWSLQKFVCLTWRKFEGGIVDLNTLKAANLSYSDGVRESDPVWRSFCTVTIAFCVSLKALVLQSKLLAVKIENNSRWLSNRIRFSKFQGGIWRTKTQTSVCNWCAR